MSFVGPRPDIPFSVGLYKEYHVKRLLVKSGMTGAWQVLPDRRWLSFDELVKTDLDYISRLSLFPDIKNSLLTIREVLTFRSPAPKSKEKKALVDEMKYEYCRNSHKKYYVNYERWAGYLK